MSGPPFLLVITSDPETLNRVAGELERRYSPDYEVARATSAQEAAATSERLALDGRLVALIISSLRLSDGDGWEAMAFVRARTPAHCGYMCESRLCPSMVHLRGRDVCQA